MLAELLQNAVDGIRRQQTADGPDFVGKIEIEIDTATNSVCVRDNGCGLSSDQIPKALAPNGSFKLMGQD